MKLLPKDLESEEITNDIGEKFHHLFEEPVITAINAALAVNRPLLIWGETGIGKSQLAKAVAKNLNRVYIPFVCDAHTESRDLLWHFDAVARLADAQVQGVIPKEERKEDTLNIKNYVVPQALWWGLNWQSAKEMPRACEPVYEDPCHPDNGTVILLDEIDKTTADVPNGLLEVLGNNRFHPQGLEAVEADEDAPPPLIIVTTNGEQNLPDAFIRRCLSLHLDFPKEKEQQRDLLVKRGAENFPQFASLMVKNEQEEEVSLLVQAANMLIQDRSSAEEKHLYPLCGQAEYFDLLRGIKQLHKQGYNEPAELLEQLRPYIYQKLKG